MVDKPPVPPQADNNSGKNGTEPVASTSDKTTRTPDATDTPVVGSDHPNVQSVVGANSMDDAVKKGQALNQAAMLDQTGTHEFPKADDILSTGDDPPEGHTPTEATEAPKGPEGSKNEAGKTDAILGKLPAEHQAALQRLPEGARAAFAQQIDGMEADFAKKVTPKELDALVNTFNARTKEGATAKPGETIESAAIASIKAQRAQSERTVTSGSQSTNLVNEELPPGNRRATTTEPAADPATGTTTEVRQPVRRSTDTPAVTANDSATVTADVPVTTTENPTPAPRDRAAETAAKVEAGEKQLKDLIEKQTAQPEQSPVKPDTRKSLAIMGFEPKPGAYNPVNVPGFSEEGLGEQHTSEKAAKHDENYDIDSRKMDSQIRNADLSITRTYSGEVDSGILSDTAFTATETVNKNSQLESRSVTYASPLDLTFDTPNGPKRIADVKQVDTKYDAERDRYVSTIYSKDGTQHEAIVKTDGTVEKFEQSVTQSTLDLKDHKTQVWQDRAGNVTQVQEGNERWTKQPGTNHWVKQNENGEYVDADNKVVASADKAASFNGNFEVLKDKSLKRTDADHDQTFTTKPDGTIVRVLNASRPLPEYTITTSPDGTTKLDALCGSFDTKNKTLEVGKNGELTFTDSDGKHVLAKDGTLTTFYPDRANGFSTIVQGVNGKGERYTQSITFGKDAKINGVNMAGTWNRGPDGQLTNGTQKFDGEINLKDFDSLSFTMKDAQGLKGTGELKSDGTSYTTYKDADGNYVHSTTGYKDGSTLDTRQLSGDQAKEIAKQLGDETLEIIETTRTDASGKTFKIWEANRRDGCDEETFVGKVQDQNGRTWVLSDKVNNKWSEVDSKGKPVYGENGEQNSFSGTWSYRQNTEGGTTVSRVIGHTEGNAFSPDFTVDYRSNGQITITNQEVPMFGYNTDARVGPNVTRGANGDLTITSVNTKDQLTIKANGDVVSTNLALNPHGLTGLVEGTDSNGEKYVKQVTLNGSSTVGPGAGTWRRTGDSDSTKWEQIDPATGKPTGQKFDGNFELNSRLLGNMTVTDNNKHTKDSTIVSAGFQKHEQFDKDNKTLLSSYETGFDKSTITHDITSDEKRISDMGLDKAVKPPIDTVVSTDANGNKITYYEGRDAKGNAYVARIDGPSGTWIRSGDEKSNTWNKVTPLGERNENGEVVYQQTGETFYGNVVRAGKTAIFSNDRDNQRTMFQADGSYVKELLTEKTEVSSDLKVTPTKEAEYTIRTDKNGNTSVYDNTSGATYSSTGSGANKLEIGPDGKMSFTDGDGRNIQIAQDGSRTIKDAEGNVLTTDAGGRMLKQFDATGKVVASYNYEQSGDKVYLKSFENASGYWKMTELPGGKQKWDLMNADDGAAVSLQADKIYVNRDNSMVFEQGNTRTVRKLDGTEVICVTEKNSQGGNNTTVSVGTRVGDKSVTSFSLKTQTDQYGNVIHQDLTNSAGETSSRDADNFWTTVKKNGEVERWAGQLSIDDSGTLRRISYKTEQQGDKLVVVTQGNDKTPVVDNYQDTYTDGTSWQTYTNGARVYRDREGDVQYRKNASGEEISIDYTTGSPKTVTGFKQGDTYWKLNAESGRFIPVDEKNPTKVIDRLNDSKVWVSIDSTTGDIIRKNLVTNDVNTSKLDGTTLLEREDGTKVFTDAQGRPTKQIDANKNEFDLTYDKDGLAYIKARIRTGTAADGTPTYQEMSVATENYKGPGADKAVIGKNLKIEGFNERYLSFETPQGHRVEVYPDKTFREYAGKTVDSGVIRVDYPDGTTILSKNYDKSQENRPFDASKPASEQRNSLPPLFSRGKVIENADIIAAPKTDFEQAAALGKPGPNPPSTPQEIVGADKSVIYRNEKGNLVQRWGNGAEQEYEKVEKTDTSPEVVRLKSSTNSAGLVTTYEYSPTNPTLATRIETRNPANLVDNPADPTGPKIPEVVMVLNRDAQTGVTTWSQNGGTPVEIKNFSIMGDNRIMISHTDNPNNPRFLEFLDGRNGTKLVINKDRSVIDFDTQNRMTHKRDAAGNEYHFTYNGNERIPSTVKNQSGTWNRILDPNNPNPKEGDVTSYSNAKTGTEWSGIVSTEGGNYRFEDLAGRKTEPQADGSEKHTYRDGTVEITRDGKTDTVTDTTGRITKYIYEPPTSQTPTDFQVLDKNGKVVATAKDFVKEPYSLSSIERNPANALPIIKLSPEAYLAVKPNGVGLITDTDPRVVDGPASKVLGLVRPGDHALVTVGGKDGVKEINVDASGKIEIVNKDGTKEHFKSEGTRVITDADNNPLETQSIDGKTTVKFQYITDAKGNKVLNEVTRTTLDNQTPPQNHITKYVKEGDKFVEKVGTSESNLTATGATFNTMSTFSDNVFLYSKESKLQRTLDADGTEWEVQRSADEKTFTRVERDALGRVTSVQDENYNITRFIRNENGELTRILMGQDELWKTKDGTWVSKANPNLQIKLNPADGPVISANGDQTWTDDQNNVRVVRADGSVELSRPDGSKSIYSSDGSSTRTIYGPGGDIQEVTAGADGSVEVILRSGEVLRQSAYSTTINSSTRGSYEGSLEVGKNGVLTVFTDGTKTADVYYTNGQARHLQHAVTGNIDNIVGKTIKDEALAKKISEQIKASPTQAEQILKDNNIDLDSPQGKALLKDLKAGMLYADVNSEDYVRSLDEIGAVGPYRRDNEFNMNDAVERNQLNRGLESLHRTNFDPNGQNTQTPTSNPNTPPLPTGDRPPNPIPGMGETGNISDTSHATGTVSGNQKIIEDALNAATLPNGAKLTAAQARELSSQIAANPGEAANLLKQSGFDEASAKVLSAKIAANIDTANDTARDDIIKNALKENGVPANRVDEITAKLNANPEKAKQILEDSGFSAENADKVLAKVKSDSDALAAVSGQIIGDNLKNSKLTPEQTHEIVEQIKADPSQAAAILEAHGLSKAEANNIANEINKDMRTFNQIREAAQDKGVSAEISSKIALETYNTPNKVAEVSARYGVGADVSTQIGDAVKTEAVNDSVQTNPVPGDTLTPAHNGPPTQVDHTGAVVLDATQQGPFGASSAPKTNGPEEKLRTADREEKARNDARDAQNQSTSAAADNSANLERDRVLARHEEQIAEQNRQAEQARQQEQQREQQQLEQKRSERERVERQQQEERTRLENEQRQQREQLLREQQKERERLEQQQKAELERVEQARKADIERRQKADKERLLQQQEQKRLALEAQQKTERQQLLDRQKEELAKAIADAEKRAEAPAAPGDSATRGRTDASTNPGGATAPEGGAVARDGTTTGTVVEGHGTPTQTSEVVTDPAGGQVGTTTPSEIHDGTTAPGEVHTGPAGEVHTGTTAGETHVDGAVPTGPAGTKGETSGTLPGGTRTETLPAGTTAAEAGAVTTTVQRDSAGNIIKTETTPVPIPVPKPGTANGTAAEPAPGTTDSIKKPDINGETTTDVTTGDTVGHPPVVPAVPTNGIEVVTAPGGQATPLPGTEATLDRVGTVPAGDIVKGPGKVSSTVDADTIDTAPTVPGTVVNPAPNGPANQTGTVTPPVSGQEPPAGVPAGQTTPLPGTTTTTPAGQTVPATDPLNRATDPSGAVVTPIPGQQQGQGQQPAGQGTQTGNTQEPSAPVQPGTQPGSQTGTPAGQQTTPPQGQTSGQEPPAGQVPGNTPLPGNGQTTPQPAPSGQTQTDPLNRGTTDPSSVVTAPGQTTPAGQAPGTQAPAGTTPGQQTPGGQTGQEPAQQTPGQHTPGQTGQTGQTGQNGTTPTGQEPAQQQPGQTPPTGQTGQTGQNGQTGTTPAGQEPSQQLPKGQTDPNTTGQLPSGQLPTQSGQTGTSQTGQTGTTPTGQEPGQQLPKGQTDPNNTGQVPSGQQPTQGQTGTTPGQTGTTPGQTGTTPAQEPGQQPSGQQGQTGGQTGQTPPTGTTTGQEPGQQPTGQQGQQPGHAGQTPPTGTTTGQEPGQQPTGQQGQNLPKQTDPNSAPATGQLPTQGNPAGPQAPAGQTGQTGQTLPTQGQTDPQNPSGPTAPTGQNGQTAPTQGQTGQTDPQGGQHSGQTAPGQTVPTQGQADPQGQTGAGLPSGHAPLPGTTPQTVPQQGSTTTDPSGAANLPKTVDPNMPTAGTTSSTTAPTSTGTSTTTDPSSMPAGTTAGHSAQSGPATTGPASATTDPNAPAAPLGNAATTAPAGTATGHAAGTTDPSGVTGQLGNADPNGTLGNNPTGTLQNAGNVIQITGQDLASQIATTAIVVAVLNGMSQSSHGTPQVQQKPTVDPGSTTVTTAPTPAPTTTPSSYSEPAPSSGSTTYTPPASNSSTTSNTDPTTTQTGSTTISTGTATPTHSTPVSTPTTSTTEPASSTPVVHTPAPKSEPAQTQHQTPAPTSSSEPVVTPPTSHQQPSTTTPVHNNAPTTPSNPTTTQQTLNQQPSSPAHTAASTGTGPAPAQSTQHGTPSQTPPASGSSNQDDENAHSSNAAAAHANAANQTASEPGTVHVTTNNTNTHQQTVNKAQHQAPANTAPQARQQAQAPSHGSSANAPGSHAPAAPLPSAPASTGSGSASSPSGTANNQQTPTTGNPDPTATAAVNAGAAAQGAVVGQGNAADPTAQVGLATNDPNAQTDPNAPVDPNAQVAVSSQDPQDPTQVTPDPSQAQTQDPTAQSQDQKQTEEPAKVQDPTIAQDQSQSDTILSDKTDGLLAGPADSRIEFDIDGLTVVEEKEIVLEPKSTRADYVKSWGAEDLAQTISNLHASDKASPELPSKAELFDFEANQIDHAAEKARIEAQVEEHFNTYIRSIDPPFVDMSGDRVIEKHMPDGTTLLTFTDGVSAWVKGDQVTVIDSEGDISSFKGHIENNNGHVTIYDANYVVVHSTEQIETANEKSHYTFVFVDGDESKQISIPQDWSISFGVDGGQIVSDARGNVMIVIDVDGTSAKYVGPDEFKSTYGHLNGDVTIIDATTKQHVYEADLVKNIESNQSPTSKVTLLDFNPNNNESTTDGGVRVDKYIAVDEGKVVRAYIDNADVVTNKDGDWKADGPRTRADIDTATGTGSGTGTGIGTGTGTGSGTGTYEFGEKLGSGETTYSDSPSGTTSGNSNPTDSGRYTADYTAKSDSGNTTYDGGRTSEPYVSGGDIKDVIANAAAGIIGNIINGDSNDVAPGAYTQSGNGAPIPGDGGQIGAVPSSTLPPYTAPPVDSTAVDVVPGSTTPVVPGTTPAPEIPTDGIDSGTITPTPLPGPAPIATPIDATPVPVNPNPDPWTQPPSTSTPQPEPWTQPPSGSSPVDPWVQPPASSAPNDPVVTLPGDSVTGSSPIDPVAGKPIDPTTGLPYDPDSGKLLDPATGQAIGNYVPQPDSASAIVAGDRPPVVVDKHEINKHEEGVLDNKQYSPVDKIIETPRVDATEFAGSESPQVATNANANADDTDGSRNLVDILNDEIIRMHDNIESRLEEIRKGVHGTRTDTDATIASFDPEAAADVSSRIDDIEKVADEREQAKQDQIKDEDDRKRDEEEERLKKRKEEVKKLADTMQAIIATKRREEMERVRKLLEQQRKIEEFIIQDTRQTKYTVRYDDSLDSIAKKMFKDPRVAQLIYEMNKNKITLEIVDGKPVYHIKPGTELTLPSPRQAREWVMRGKYLQVDELIGSDTIKTMSEKEKEEFDGRRKNVESVLGAIGFAAAAAAEGGVKYNVRLGDSLRSVAMKHPMLNDVSLWRLLAEKNNLPTATDKHGIPTAILKRGTKLTMPTKQEIVEFRKKIGVLTHPASTWLNDSSTDGPESSRTSKKCSDCKRQAPVGVSICPSCGHIFEPVPSTNVQKASFTVVTKPPKAGIETKDDAITVDAPRKHGVKTKDDPLVETADDNKVVDLSEHSGVVTQDEPSETGVKTNEDLKPAANASSGVKTKDESDKSGVITREENKPYVTTDPGYNNGVKTEEDRTVFVARTPQTDIAAQNNAIDPSSAITQEINDQESTVIVKNGVVTAQLPDAEESTVIVSGVPKQPIVDGVSASESLIQGISSLHDRDKSATTGGVNTGELTASQQLHVERFTEQLSDTCRLVQLDSSRANKRSTRLQLEVLREGKWISVIAYEIAAEKSVRHEYSLSGKTKSMKMDLPSGALEAMVQNDLTRNWKSYCEKFLTGKKISA
jgi:YD repeat-containing protein